MILVHGITDDGLCWLPVARALPPQYDLVLMDMRGHGESDAPQDDGYTLDNMASELAAGIRALQLKKPVVLGHSMGAFNALLLAGMHPDIPRAIILEDPPPFWKPGHPSPETDASRASLAEWILGEKRKTKDELYAEVRANNPGWSGEAQKLWVDSKLRFNPAISQLVNPFDPGRVDIQKIAGRISCPAAFISADKSLGAMSGEEDIALLKQWIPQLENHHIEGAGHVIHWDRFDTYMKALQNALDGFAMGK
ncbi:MAG: alpha/beta fold hydrolase [Anaerolineales bacterium]|nr:alpha/beta fold hydrolase [Anaerolineales bacterium]